MTSYTFQLECSTCGGSPILHRGLCASCLKAERDAEKKKNKPVKKPKPIPKKSTKRKEQSKEYAVLRRGFLRMHPKCQARLIGCADLSVDIHHSAGRSGKEFLNIKNWMAVCRHCHSICHDKLSAKERREKGLLKTVDLNRDVEKEII